MKFGQTVIGFLQYGTSARQQRPCGAGSRDGARETRYARTLALSATAEEGGHAGRLDAWRKEVFAASRCAGRDGAETLRAPAVSIHRGPQGKATVEAPRAGCPPAARMLRIFQGVRPQIVDDTAFPFSARSTFKLQSERRTVYVKRGARR
jgi:hypothetical protein